MHLYIQYSLTKLINFLFLCFLIISCNGEAKFQDYQTANLSTPSGESLKVYLAISKEQQIKGLSGLADSNFSNSEGMLFYGKEDKERQFWMPNTHFNLDIVFLNEDFYVIDIHKNLKHFPYNGPRESVPISKSVKCRHVLEIKASSPVASKIHPGMMLKWNEQMSLEQIVSKTHQQQ